MSEKASFRTAIRTYADSPRDYGGFFQLNRREAHQIARLIETSVAWIDASEQFTLVDLRTTGGNREGTENEFIHAGEELNKAEDALAGTVVPFRD